MDVRFSWDEEKNASNIKKHGISFKEAAVVFKDPKRLEMYDGAHSFFEERWKMIGLNNSTMLTVIYTERIGSIRIISARKADKKEEEKYFYGYRTFHTN
jgi:uncharacterized DUF497 family protein